MSVIVREWMACRWKEWKLAMLLGTDRQIFILHSYIWECEAMLHAGGKGRGSHCSCSNGHVPELPLKAAWSTDLPSCCWAVVPVAVCGTVECSSKPFPCIASYWHSSMVNEVNFSQACMCLSALDLYSWKKTGVMMDHREQSLCSAYLCHGLSEQNWEGLARMSVFWILWTAWISKKGKDGFLGEMSASKLLLQCLEDVLNSVWLESGYIVKVK